MTTKKILVTGGAGFIGSHLVDDLIAKDHTVFVFDNLESRVHGKNANRPDYLSSRATFIEGDLRDYEILKEVIQQHDIQIIFHLGASVGIGLSMYRISEFIHVNTLGTAHLLNILANENHTVEKFLVASSNTIYGEGQYICEDDGIQEPNFRHEEKLSARHWELSCPVCGKFVSPIPTPESKSPNPTSIYAQSKYHQEQMTLLIGKTYGIPVTALRFFNVYGSRQALSNPYTGVCAIFSANLLNGNAPVIYEDGQQSRDLIYVKDICQGLVLSMEKPGANYQVMNLGTGKATTILHVAEKLADYINPKIRPKITNQFRKGDIRHCIADISKIRSKVGYKPKYEFTSQIRSFVDWVRSHSEGVVDRTGAANKTLAEKNLI